jgi:hypothetical protein
MPLGSIFWMLMIFWLIFGVAWNSFPTQFGPAGSWGNWFLLFILFAILGWHDFGPVIH